MATKTPIPPGPPPRGFRWPDQPPTGSTGPLGRGPTSERTVVVQPGRHGVAVFVGIVALVVGLVIGYQLGGGAADSSDSAAPADLETDTEAPTVTTTPATTSPPTSDGGAVLAPLGTRENPIPLGQGWILGIWQLTVRSADLDATKTILGASNGNPPPADGSVYVLIDIELELLDDLFVFADDFLPGLETADETTIINQFQPCGPSVPDDFYENGRLGVDEPVRGRVCFEVESDATDGLLLTTQGVGDATTYFSLQD